MTIKLKTLIESVLDAITGAGAQHIFIEIETRTLQAYCPELLLNEGQWKDSSHKGYVYRVDPPNPNVPLQRHVTIAHSQHTSAKSKQVSWNISGSRHDRSSFDTNFHGINKAKEIAREVFRLPKDFKLEHLSSPADAILLLEEVEDIPEKAIIFKA